MIKKSRLLLGLLMATPGLAHAVGLGDLRLASGLNQPLAAEIELVGATQDELTALRAGLASQEAFARFGLDRPQYLSAVSFRVTRDAAGRNVIELRSSQPITEPFVTFLVEVSWPRGRLIREYTVLLDPPVFEERATTAVPVTVPRTGEPELAAAGAETRPVAPRPAATLPAAPLPAATPLAEAALVPSRPATAGTAAAGGLRPGGEYRVVSGDTLSSLARRLGATSSAEVDRLMIAIFQANPGAFAGNINRLRRGEVLSIPGADALAGLAVADAQREVRRQMAEWRATVAPADGAARLRLVTPSEPIVAPGPAPASPAEQAAAAQAAAAAAAQAAAEQAAAAQAAAAAAAAQAAEAQRLLEVKNAELARLQAQQAQPATPPLATPPAPAQAPGPEAAVPPAGDAGPAVAAAPVVVPAPTRPVAAAEPAAAEPGLLTRLTDHLLYVALAGAALLLAVLLGFRVLQRRREVEADYALQPLDRGDVDADAKPPAPGGTGRITRTVAPTGESILVEESEDDSGEFVAPKTVRPAAAPAARGTSPRAIDDTQSAEAAVDLDQADPLAEADFHMAYGLYDQAVDIVKLAIDREPGRRDLQLKLLEVYFVWGNRDAFLDVARQLARARDTAAAGEWSKVGIMGRQIAPDDPLFAGPVGRAADVDLELEAGGSPGVDLELLGDQTMPPAARTVDLDVGQALGTDSLADTGESPALDPDRLDFNFDEERSGATTREMAPRLDSPTVKEPGLGGTTREMAPRFDSPTVEQPLLRVGGADSPTVENPVLTIDPGNTIREKLDSALLRRTGESRAEATAELSLDDLGLDQDSIESTSSTLQKPDGAGFAADAPTMIAGLGDRSREFLRAADEHAGRTLPALEQTRAAPRPADELAQRAHAAGFDGITEVLAMDPSHTVTARALADDSNLDLDLDELAKALDNDTIEQPRRDDLSFSQDVFGTATRNGGNGSGLDLDVGSPVVDRAPTVTERINVDDLALPDLEPVTLSEVGTKLDLARAYMDMGDPDGARSILQEVLTEGSATQKNEAQRLIETLPG